MFSELMLNCGLAVLVVVGRYGAWNGGAWLDFFIFRSWNERRSGGRNV